MLIRSLKMNTITLTASLTAIFLLSCEKKNESHPQNEMNSEVSKAVISDPKNQSLEKPPSGTDMAIQHYQFAENRPILIGFPKEHFKGSPTKIILEKKISNLKDLNQILEARSTELKKRHPVLGVFDYNGFFVVSIGSLNDNILREAYLVPKNSSHLVYWMDW